MAEQSAVSGGSLNMRKAIIEALRQSTPDVAMHGAELRRRLKSAGYGDVIGNAAYFYGILRTMKQLGQIGGGMINGKRCYWASSPSPGANER